MITHNIELTQNIFEYTSLVADWVSTLSEADVMQWYETKQGELYEVYNQMINCIA